MSFTFAVDYDGTLVENDPPKFRQGAVRTLVALKAAGHRLILHSCRCIPIDPGPTIEEDVANFYVRGTTASRVEDQWQRFVEMRSFLQGAKLWDLFDEIWQAPGKPLADFFVDDKMEPPEWDGIASQFTQRGGRA